MFNSHFTEEIKIEAMKQSTERGYIVAKATDHSSSIEFNTQEDLDFAQLILAGQNQRRAELE